jgi:hypothetical protein
MPLPGIGDTGHQQRGDDVDDVDMDAIDHWLRHFADAIGQPVPDRATVEQILELAGVAAHASARQAAPVACWMAGMAGLSLDEALRLAASIGGTEDH